jgi:hypothetical protein
MACSNDIMADAAVAQAAVATSTPRRGFYQRVLRAFTRHDVPCLIGGTYALEAYTGIRRTTKDLDLFILRDDWSRAAAALEDDGVATDLTFPHWLGKAGEGRHYVDLLFGSGNGICAVDKEWFAHARPMRVWGVHARLCPPEEMIWSKSFVQERERFDGADVLHLLRAQADTLDWPRLLDRFGPNWEVLLSHLVLFGFVFPGDRGRVPPDIMHQLIERYQAPRAAAAEGLCRGTLLSREQYLVDVEYRGDRDARIHPHGALSLADLVPWTAEIPAARRAILSQGRFVTPSRERT